MTEEQATTEQNMSNLITAQKAQIDKQRAVIAELRALVGRLLKDRDQHVAAILHARSAYHGLDTVKIEAVPLPEEVQAPKSRIGKLAQQLAGNGA